MNGLEAQFRIAEIEINQSTLDEKIIGMFRYESESKGKRGPSVFICAEIFSTLYVYEQLLDVINETTERTRHLTVGVDTDPMARFEKLIEKVNEGVARFLKDEPTPITWNRVNIFILELSEGHISLSGLGRLTNVFLQKQSDGSYRSFDLLGSLEQPALVQPQKPFASLICGDVQPGDLLFIGTQNFERLRNEIGLVERLTKLPPVTAALDLKKAVEEQHIPDDYAGAVIARVELPLQTVSRPREKSHETLKTKSTESVEKMYQEVQKTQAMLSPALPPLASGTDQDRPPLQERLWTFLHVCLQRLKHWLQEIKEKAPALKDPMSLASLRGMNAGHGSFMTQKRKVTLLSTGAGVIIIIIGIFWFYHAKRSAAEQALWMAVYDQAFDRRTRAEADIIYGNEDRAQGYVKEARGLLAGLDEKTSQRKKTWGDLDASLKELETKLRREIHLDHPRQLLSGVGMDRAKLVTTWKHRPYALSQDGESLINLDATLGTRRIPLPATSGTPIGITAGTNEMLILTKSQKLIRIDPERLTAKQVSLGMTHASGSQAIHLYNRKLYSLDPASNMVWKYNAQADGFGSETTYLKQTSTDLRNTIGITIDANIYVANQNGLVTRYLSGVQESWSLRPIDPPLTSISGIWTDPDTDRLVVADLVGKRVLVFHKDGQLIAQISSADFQGPEAVSGDGAQKKIYLVDQQRLFSLDLP